ncbi:MAG: hypothetical protein O7G83_09020 [Proteobacteria bacterium]|nr:hypothetical protein [Pseudomonadota bacterium]
MGVGPTLEAAGKALHEGRPSEALRTLQKVDELEPDNPWLWFYRGLAHHRLEDYHRAVACFDKTLAILKGLDDPYSRQLAASAIDFQRRARRKILSLSLETGLAYDSNVTFLGGGTAGGLGLITGRGDGVFATRFDAMFAPVSNALERLEFKTRLNHSWHFSIEDFDVQDYGMSVRYTRKLSDRWKASLEYGYDLTYLGNDPFSSIHVLRPGLSYKWQNPPDFTLAADETFVFYEFGGREFLFETIPAFDRDGTAHSVGVFQSLRLRPIPRHVWEWQWLLGYRFDSIFTDGTEFDRRTHNFLLGLQIPLIDLAVRDRYRYLLFPGRELTFRYNAQFQIANYRNASIIDADFDRRSDYIVSHSFALSQTLMDDPDYGELVLRAIIAWTDANSNVTSADRATPFTYDKMIYGFQLRWTW